MRRATLASILGLCLVARVGSAEPPEIQNRELFRKSLEAAEQALEYYGPYENREEMKRVAEIGYQIARESGFRKFPFSFYLVDLPVPNAFALPGGHIFLTKGMLDLGLDDDMLAGLLGHEIGHVVKEHGLRMQRKAKLLNLVSTAVLAGVIISADSGSRGGGVPDQYGRPNRDGGDRVEGAMAAGVVITELLLRSYSREFEDEADDEGQRLAAAAGFDPTGTERLMALMGERLPQNKEYGYWRTHPFFDQRVRAAGIRAGMLKIQEPRPTEDYRRETQEVLLDYRERHELEQDEEDGRPKPDLVKFAALFAWPRGEAAAELRWERLERLRDAELERPELSRDFGRLIAAFAEEADEVRELDPESSLLTKLERELGSFEIQRDGLYTEAVEIYRGGIFETGFLTTFLSNYPEAPERPEIALDLGRAMSRLRRPAEAVPHYLTALAAGEGSEASGHARRGLRNLVPLLDSLAALQELADQQDDPELQRAAALRLAELAPAFEDLTVGAAYLKRYPDGEHSAVVAERVNALAEDLYGEVVLYQTVGDHVKALERIQTILLDAPLSQAAERLRDQAVLG